MIRSLFLTLTLAYVMPAQSILRRMSEARADVKLSDLTMTGTVKVGPALAKEVADALSLPWASGELNVSMRLTTKVSGRCKLEILAPETGKSIILTSDAASLPSASFRSAQVALIESCALLSTKGAQPPQTKSAWDSHLSALRVDTRVSSLGRFAGTVAFVIGDTKPESAQLWVYKNHFLPARLRLPDNAKSGAIDLRFLDYTNQATGEAFPRSIEVYQRAEFQWRFLVVSAEAAESTDNVKKSK
jgi:hypothetical protein